MDMLAFCSIIYELWQHVDRVRRAVLALSTPVTFQSITVDVELE